MQDSVFTKIIRGDIPCHKIYEDELTFAFLTIGPKQPGHTLVIPKKQIDHLWDLPERDYQAVLATAQRVARRIHEVLRPARVGMEVVGLDVPHAHVHIFPFNTKAEFEAAETHPADEELAIMATKLRMKDGV